MKSKKFLLPLFLLVMVLTSCTKNDDPEIVQDNSANEQDASSPAANPTVTAASISDQYIVVLNKDATISGLDIKGKKDHVKGKALGLLKKYEISGVVKDVYETALEGFVVKATPGQLSLLQKDPQVKYVEADQLVYISARKTKPAAPVTTEPTPSPSPNQNIPWGITRVGGGAIYTGSNVAWILDTGIDLTHPDLNVDALRAVSYVTGVTSPNDDNGHGTHVAGIIGAISNNFGVVGVAAGAKVVPVKVLDSTGCGAFSAILSGLNYAMANCKAGDVLNLSMNTGISPTFDDVILKASAVLKIALSAGNNADWAYNYSPGRANGPNIYTVSAMISGDYWAGFSNYGNTSVDFCAPGSNIYSTFRNGSYAYKAGTSMAAPHVAGLLLLGSIATSGYVSNDPDGTPDPIAHK